MKNLINSFVKSDIVRRAVKTFIQAFLSVLILGIATVDSVEAAKALAIASLAAAISATWNFIKKTM